MLLEALARRREVASAALTDTGIDTVYHLNFCPKVPGQKLCYFTKTSGGAKDPAFLQGGRNPL